MFCNPRMIPFLLLIAVLLLVAGGALAQVVGPDYRISPGDTLQVLVYGETEPTKDYAVGPGGSMNIPLVGQITVADLTLAQAQALITEKLKAVLRAPQVEVGLNETASNRKAYVLGYVNTQGPMLLPFGATVMDALAAAGMTDLSDLRRVQLTHAGQMPVTLDLSGLRTGARVEIAEKVRYGDVIYVPHLEDRIAVLGLVKTPASAVLPLGQEVNVLDALARIGGGLAEGMTPGTALLVRQNGQVAPINLEALLKRGDSTQNLLLQPGDALVVQQTENISVVGEVNKPLTFGNASEVTVLEALAQAGGFTPKADLENARIVSASGASRPVDVKALWESGDLSQNVKLNPGDVLLMPEMPPQNLLVVGEVQHPGVMELVDVKQRDILRLVTAAGEMPGSDLTRVHVFRTGQEPQTVNVDAVRNGDLLHNLQLQPDDVVMVPKKQSVYVFGDVNRQGAIPWDSTLKILDVISQAGGLGQRANENGTVLVRLLPECKTETIPIRLGDLAKGKCPENFQVQPGDVVFVPTLGQRGAILDILRELLWGASTVAAFSR